MICVHGNPFIDMYTNAQEQIQRAWANTEDMQIILNPSLQLVVKSESNCHRTNLSTALEVAAFIADGYKDHLFRENVIAERTAAGTELSFHKVSYANAAYFPLHYVLLFPQGQTGWHWGLQLCIDDDKCVVTQYSQRAWLQYHLFLRSS